MVELKRIEPIDFFFFFLKVSSNLYFLFDNKRLYNQASPRPRPKSPTTKKFYPLQKRPHLIVKGSKFYKKYEFFQIVVHFLLLVMLGILQILL